ncbi:MULTISPECIES: poly-beta-1,6-N-acetyl-D-glucosamine biosynthesis protein PgaD [Chromobacterium]|uniref:poly-beta-1,6-N-acetyl-D-glucosamine biosynthesis protein PgaD n=1 Tax=Chromobacterium TaxID=535 RepID=UPI000DEF71BC|nr:MULTISPECIES: poly-beta-1,6-N-acetyl-D-glucosamine biosynthesis protein PgaD [Chromobacterium]QOZ85037.1 poly-beta-1,6-N-acetyl-D-glucosamine biosynthesis protein PgaD [Chromobacterium sp. Rain0013]WON85249.1 poly-beta-1,6-N-acetyl-D-glucosamine biosynthesis protein PgaD [Chromobacterium haemolyticum]
MSRLGDGLIIQASHNMSALQRLLSWLMTLVCWLAWLYLWLPALAYVGYLIWGRDVLPAALRAEDAPEHLDKLRDYGLEIALIGLCLLLWSRINYWRFTGKQKRSPIPNVALEKLAEDLGLPPDELREGQAAKVAVVHHCDEGGIARIETVTRLPPPA